MNIDLENLMSSVAVSIVSASTAGQLSTKLQGVQKKLSIKNFISDYFITLLQSALILYVH